VLYTGGQVEIRRSAREGKDLGPAFRSLEQDSELSGDQISPTTTANIESLGYHVGSGNAVGTGYNGRQTFGALGEDGQAVVDAIGVNGQHCLCGTIVYEREANTAGGELLSHLSGQMLSPTVGEPCDVPVRCHRKVLSILMW
jgi:hypothetical protein